MTKEELKELFTDMSEGRMAMLAAMNPGRFREICTLIGISSDNSPTVVIAEARAFIARESVSRVLE